MKTTHTPGPWGIHKQASMVVAGSKGFAVASCGGYSDNGTDTEELQGELLANARLIAAAPDNFECNKELSAIVRELCTAYGHPLPEASLARSDAAIAKAIGETL